jgi:uncharacterized membrane protein
MPWGELSLSKSSVRNSLQAIFWKMRKGLGISLAVVGVLHPFFLYFGLKMYSSRTIAFLLGIFVIGSFFLQERHEHQTRLFIPFFLIVFMCIFGVILNSSIFILYLPCFISGSLLVSFGYSLVYPPTTIEVFARMLVSDLSPEEIVYCRRVTLLWVVFFLLNGTAALYTACCTSLEVWSLYNGLIAYVVMGMLFVAELSYRSWRFRRYPGLPTDVIFKKLFPPKV